MSARRKEINVQLNQLLDAVMLGGILWGCHALRYYGIFIVDALYEIPPFSAFYWMLAILMPFGPFLLEIQGFYNHPLDKSVVKSVAQIFRAGLWLVLLLGTASFFLRLDIPSRSVLILFAIFSPLALLAKDRLLALRYYRKLQRGAGGEPVIFAGEPDKIRLLIGGFTATQRLEVKVVERVDLVSGGVDDLVSAIHRHSVGRVILAFSRIELEKVQKAIEACELEGVEAWMNADFIRTSVARPAYETFGRSAMLVFRATPEISWAMMLKNLMDRVGAACILMAVSPILIAAAVAVRLSSKGPIIFRQQRAGLHGKPFTMFKFRTMCADAEKRKAEIEGLNTMSGPVFKVDNDPRVTKAGHFLRRTSIDELPQLLNVFLGDMSLVGPRPLPLYEVEKFEYAAHRRRLSMKPGLTCLWQVRGRNSVTSFDDWVKMDLEYIDNWSLTLDIVILLRTVPVVLFGWGAK